MNFLELIIYLTLFEELWSLRSLCDNLERTFLSNKKIFIKKVFRWPEVFGSFRSSAWSPRSRASSPSASARARHAEIMEKAIPTSYFSNSWEPLIENNAEIMEKQFHLNLFQFNCFFSFCSHENLPGGVKNLTSRPDQIVENPWLKKLSNQSIFS